MYEAAQHDNLTGVECYELGYRVGLLDALRRYAWSKDGEHWVGDGLFTLQQAIERELERMEGESKLQVYEYPA